MRIVNPTFGIDPEEKAATAQRGPADWLHDPIVLFSNGKPNAKELLEALRSKLAALRNVDDVGFVSKDNAGVPAPTAMLDMVAGKYRIALHALAD